MHAGGVAIFNNNEYSDKLKSEEHILYKYDKKNIRQIATSQDGVEDICAAAITIDGQRAVLVSVYISPLDFF